MKISEVNEAAQAIQELVKLNVFIEERNRGVKSFKVTADSRGVVVNMKVPSEVFTGIVEQRRDTLVKRLNELGVDTTSWG